MTGRYPRLLCSHHCVGRYLPTIRWLVMRTFTPAAPEKALPTQAPMVLALCIILTDHVQLLHNAVEVQEKAKIVGSLYRLLLATPISNPIRHPINSLQLTATPLLHNGSPLGLFMLFGHGQCERERRWHIAKQGFEII